MKLTPLIVFLLFVILFNQTGEFVWLVFAMVAGILTVIEAIASLIGDFEKWRKHKKTKPTPAT